MTLVSKLTRKQSKTVSAMRDLDIPAEWAILVALRADPFWTPDYTLPCAFYFDSSLEGFDFWNSVVDGWDSEDRYKGTKQNDAL